LSQRREGAKTRKGKGESRKQKLRRHNGDPQIAQMSQILADFGEGNFPLSICVHLRNLWIDLFFTLLSVLCALASK